MTSAASSIVLPSDDANGEPLPSYLRRHIHLGFNEDDVAALLSSIDSSQSSSTSTLAHLPAELLLQILEYVPVDYILDWRLVCRGFRDAVDGRVLYHHLRRTELVGYMGPKHSRYMAELDDSEYDVIHLLEARFQHIEKPCEDAMDTSRPRPIWSGTHAVFNVSNAWFAEFGSISGAESRDGHAVRDADPEWFDTLDRLELCRAEEGFGTLRWCIRLDHAVLDLDFPVEKGRTHFDVHVNLHNGLIRVAWKDMLLRFLKTERALRLMIDEKFDSAYTFSHAEDCLRAIRRQRLQASLNLNDKADCHIQWALRLLRPLFGKPEKEHQMTTLAEVENDATSQLLLLRRRAALSTSQIAYLQQLSLDYLEMEQEFQHLDEAFGEFKSYLSMPGFQMSILMPVMNPGKVSKNPVAWTDDLRMKVEHHVERWKSQRKVVEQMKTLLQASNTAMAVPNDSFDDLSSDF